MSQDSQDTHDKTPYLHMLWASLAFTLMATFSRWAGDYCDWRLIAAARATVACVFAFLLAKFVGAKLVFWKPRILWVRSLAGNETRLTVDSSDGAIGVWCSRPNTENGIETELPRR